MLQAQFQAGWCNDAGALKYCDANFANCEASVVSIVNQRYLMKTDDPLFVYNAKIETLFTSHLHDVFGAICLLFIFIFQ